MMKLSFDRFKISEDVSVIELEIIQNCSFRPVVDELGAFVEKSGIVLVCFDHEVRGIGQPGGNAEVLRHAADKKPRIPAGCLEDPGKHGGGGSLAVGAGDCEHPLRVQN